MLQRPRLLRRALVGILVLPATLAACTAGGTSGDAPTSAGPLTDYTAEFFARTTAQAERNRVAGAEAVAACMKEQGFDVEPFVDSWSSTTTEVPDRDLAWVREHGFGLVDGEGSTTSTAAPDPNAALVAAMGTAERQAYDLALLGPADAPQDGCAALDTADRQPWLDETYQHWAAEAQRIDQEADDHADVVAALAAWRTCMDDSGVAGYGSPTEAHLTVADQVERAEGLDGVPEPARSELLELERTVATASWECEASSRLTPTRRDVVRAAQTAYVEQHRSELDAWALTWPDPADDG